MESDYIKDGKRVGCKGLDIDNELIKCLYLEDNKTLKDIGKQLGVSHWTVLSRLKKMGIKKNTRHKISNPSFFNTFTKENCYWAGFIAADGSIHKNRNTVAVEIKYEDESHLYKLCSMVGRDNGIWHRDRKKNNKIYKASAISLECISFKKSLSDNFNITSNKSQTLRPPENIPQEYLHHFIRGYIDGDGSIGWHKFNNKPRLNICSGSEQFLQWIVDNIKKNTTTGDPSVRSVKNKNLYVVEFVGNQVYNILDWLYKDSTEKTRLQRKYNIYNIIRR